MENTTLIETKGLWELSNDIDVVSYKLNSVRDVVEIIAERIVGSPESGAIWAVAEMIEVQEKQLEALSFELMNLHRERLMQDAPKPQAKKKAKKK
jgi:hypothetical protein